MHLPIWLSLHISSIRPWRAGYPHTLPETFGYYVASSKSTSGPPSLWHPASFPSPTWTAGEAQDPRCQESGGCFICQGRCGQVNSCGWVNDLVLFHCPTILPDLNTSYPVLEVPEIWNCAASAKKYHSVISKPRSFLCSSRYSDRHSRHGYLRSFCPDPPQPFWRTPS